MGVTKRYTLQPSVGVISAAGQEMGGYYAGVMAVCSTLLARAVATLFYQVAESHKVGDIVLSLLMLGVIYGGLYLIGKKECEGSSPILAIPIRRDCC